MGAARRVGTVLTVTALLAGCTVVGTPVAGTAPAVNPSSSVPAAPTTLPPDVVLPPGAGPGPDEVERFLPSEDVVIALRAQQVGTLPVGPRHTVDGVQIDDGEPVFAEGVTEPVAWLSPDTTPVEWSAALRAFPETGLWPVLVDGWDSGDLERPWRSRELEAPDTASDNGPALLEQWWSQYQADLGEFAVDQDWYQLPADWPGLSSGNQTDFIRIPGYVIDGAFGEVPQGLLLVPVDRPADAVAALGWSGAANYATPGEVSSVLRHWEVQHGAVPAYLGFDELILLATRPPGAPDQVTRLAVESYALAPDNVWQGVDFPALVDEIDASPWWYFWWD